MVAHAEVVQLPHCTRWERHAADRVQTVIWYVTHALGIPFPKACPRRFLRFCELIDEGCDEAIYSVLALLNVEARLRRVLDIPGKLCRLWVSYRPLATTQGREGWWLQHFVPCHTIPPMPYHTVYHAIPYHTIPYHNITHHITSPSYHVIS